MKRNTAIRRSGPIASNSTATIKIRNLRRRRDPLAKVLVLRRLGLNLGMGRLVPSGRTMVQRGIRD